MTTDYDSYAKDLAGNWKKFESFGWHDRPEDGENWCIVYTHTRDSKLLDLSNAAVIKRTMLPFLNEEEPDIVEEHHGHWGVGWVDGYSIRVFNNGEITGAFKRYCDLVESLEDYPVLSDEDYSEREFEASLAGIKDQVNYTLMRVDEEDLLIKDMPDDLEYKLFDWFWINNQDALEHDGDGAYPSEKDIMTALISLGFVKEATCE
jgi:hypothetical protein